MLFFAMRILISSYSCDPTLGSEPACGWNWAYHTAKQGHEVWCMTNETHKHSILCHLKQESIENLHFIFVKTFWWLDYLQRKYHYPFVYLHYLVWQHYAYREAKALHCEKDFHLVHHASYGSLQLGSRLWKLNVPFIFGPVGGVQQIPKSFKRFLAPSALRELLRSWISHLLLYRFKNTQQALQHAVLVLVYNQETHDLVKKLGAPRVELLLDGGISEAFIPPAYPVRPVREIMRVLWIGRFVSSKGLSLVIEVFKALNLEYPIYLDIIGDGPLASYYRQEVKNYRLTDVITFHGRLPFSTIKQYYAHSDVFMYCGLRNTLGIQVLEAMAYGLPLVTLNLHGIKTFIPENTGIRAELTSVEETVRSLKRALITLYLDATKREELGRNAYQYAKTQTWSIKVKQAGQQYYPSIAEKKSTLHE